jgi:hypothetical protein
MRMDDTFPYTEDGSFGIFGFTDSETVYSDEHEEDPVTDW